MFLASTFTHFHRVLPGLIDYCHKGKLIMPLMFRLSIQGKFVCFLDILLLLYYSCFTQHVSDNQYASLAFRSNLFADF